MPRIRRRLLCDPHASQCVHAWRVALSRTKNGLPSTQCWGYTGYDIHSLPWKDPPILKFGKPSIFMGHGLKPWRTVHVITAWVSANGLVLSGKFFTGKPPFFWMGKKYRNAFRWRFFPWKKNPLSQPFYENMIWKRNWKLLEFFASYETCETLGLKMGDYLLSPTSWPSNNVTAPPQRLMNYWNRW